VSIGQVNLRAATGEIAFETRDFYLACFLRCTGYELIDLRAEGRRKVFVFRDRISRRDDVLGHCHIVERRTREFCVPNIFKRPRLPRATCS
jgi:hypothetical protein